MDFKHYFFICSIYKPKRSYNYQNRTQRRSYSSYKPRSYSKRNNIVKSVTKAARGVVNKIANVFRIR